MLRVKRLLDPGARKVMAMTLAVVLVGAGAAYVKEHAPGTDKATPADIGNGNIAFSVIYPAIGPELRTFINPVAMDGTLLMRVSAMLETAWYDATVPYRPKAIGVYAHFPRRPADESTVKNINTAMVYSSYKVMDSLIPERHNVWRKMVSDAGLDPDDNSQDPTTAVGLGNLAGEKMVKERENDGMNQLGNAQKYFGQPYQNYTTYTPVNTPFKINDPSHWQPDVVSSGNGRFFSQVFITPQMKYTKPFTISDPTKFVVPEPTASIWQKDPAGYKAQADQVIDVQAHLTDAQKMTAELFNDKLDFAAVYPTSGGGCAREATPTSCTPEMMLRFIAEASSVHMASFDSQLASWTSKIKYDTERPFTAIHYLYGNKKISGWGGPGKGTVDDMPGSEWHSYLQTPDHAEYPSGTSAFCGAQVEVGRLWTGTEKIDAGKTFERGSSKIEPGVTPKEPVTLHWDTWGDLLHSCQMSRVYGGVHFYPATEQGAALGERIGKIAYDFMQRHLAGKS